MQTAFNIWFLCGLLLLIFSLLATLAFIIWIVKDGLENKKTERCFFHNFNKKPFAIAGAYWYFECPVCGKRDAIKLRRGESPVNQKWLDGDIWDNIDHPPTSQPKFLIWTPLFSQQLEIRKYSDWPYTPPHQTSS